MDLGLKDKVVVVTGASKGIGLATARLLLQEGAKVAICSVTESHLREAEQELSRLGAVYAEVVDMTQEQSVYAFADHVVEKLGPIDSWVNNVGAQLTKGPDEEEYSDALLEKIYGICFKAAVFGCQAAFRSMKHRGGSIVNISSLGGRWQRWTAFLTTASRLYKYPFHEQLMIFAQRPDATACAEYDLWNDTMRRYMRRGSKGIALVDNSREKPRLRYVFDISDTGLRKNSRHPFLWELRPEHEAAVAQALAERFGTPPENNLAEQLESIAAQLVSEYWVEHKRDIHIRPTFSLTGQPPRMCRSCWDILM